MIKLLSILCLLAGMAALAGQENAATRDNSERNPYAASSEEDLERSSDATFDEEKKVTLCQANSAQAAEIYFEIRKRCYV